MSDSNDKTLQSYDDHINEYVAGTAQHVDGELKIWLDKALSLMPKGRLVLELGSAHGKDANYIQSQGYKVLATDAVPGFVDLLSSKGFKARKLNAIKDDLGNGYDMVFANGVFLHFKPDELEKVLNKVYDSLNPDGVLAFTVKKGDGETWTDAKIGAPRFFHFWQPDDIKNLLKTSGFTLESLEERASTLRIGTEWLMVIARK